MDTMFVVRICLPEGAFNPKQVRHHALGALEDEFCEFHVDMHPHGVQHVGWLYQMHGQWQFIAGVQDPTQALTLACQATLKKVFA